MTERLRVGTRGSALALRQTETVLERLREAWPGLGLEVVVVRTQGDRQAEDPLSALGGKGAFVREIERALLQGRVDLAVHSAKDLPAELPQGLELAAFPEREDPRDVLVSRGGWSLQGLPSGSRVATGSPRRRALVLARRPDLRVEEIRGNVDTRLEKLARGQADALVLARAGLLRLGLDPEGLVPLEVEEMLPAPGQGALAVEARAGDRPVLARLTVLDDPLTRQAVEAERAFLAALGGSCRLPAAALARLDGEGGELDALIAHPSGQAVWRRRARFAPGEARQAGWALARALLQAAGDRLGQLEVPA